MADASAFPYGDLSGTDLVVDATYEGGPFGDVRDDPLQFILPCGNQGGFRSNGPGDAPTFVVLYSDLADPDWPDVLDVELGRFTYWGDNKKAGRQLHDTQRGGNLILRTMFDRLHGSVEERKRIPPFFVFPKGSKGRDVVFRGLAVPGAPDVWARWRAGRTASLLKAPASRFARLMAEQLPDDADRPMIEAIAAHFENPTDFEACAARLWEMQAGRIEYTLTRPSRDGGRDAFGTVRVGPESDPVRLESALEAKRYAFEHSVSVRILPGSSRASETGCSGSSSRRPTSISRRTRSSSPMGTRS